MTAKTDKVTIKIEGDRDMVESFMHWLDGQGEQDYWNWEEAGGREVPIRRFDYDFKKGVIVGKR